MSVCRHCKGTGQAPDQITLECVKCQCKVKITYSSSDELIRLVADVQCADCKKGESL